MKRKYNILLLLLLGYFLPTKAFVSVDTVKNYAQLRSYIGEADSIYVAHERYYGWFVKANCGEEDYGTIIVTNQTCWRRILQNYHPRYWAIGSAAQDNLIKQIELEIDAINSAAFAAWKAGGDTIEIDRIYNIDQAVYLLPNNTYLGTTDSAGFKRIDPPKTVLTDTAKVGTKRLLVKSTEGFRAFQKINISNGQAFDSIAGHVSYNASIASDTVMFLNGRSIIKQMSPGDTISLFFRMMETRYSSADTILLKNLIFDGNRQHYTLNYDWRVNATIKLPTTTNATLEKCRFYNIPSENVFLCGAKVIDCSGESFNGSAIHFSCNTFDRPTEVLYNNFSQLNEVGDSIMKHSEGGLTFSAKVRELRVAYNTLLEVGENGIGNFLNDDQSNEITDNLLDTKLATVGGLNQFYRYNSTNIIYNNKNLNFADTSARSCFQYIPQLKTAFECSGNSSAEEPLVVGDSITITLDSLQIRNSNENFLKCIEPIYNDRYFELTSIKMQTDTLSLHHKWQFNGNALCFDNGHRNGIYGHGNWGYQGCGEGENCSDIKMTFVVKNLPDSLSQVTCPLQGFEFDYDGDLGTWNRPVLCERTTVELDSKKLGKPFLEGTFISVSQDFRLNEAIKIYPNPNPTYINIDFLMPAKVNFLISNTLGQEVSSGILNSKTLHIEDLKNGIYFLVLNVNGQRVTKTFVKN